VAHEPGHAACDGKRNACQDRANGTWAGGRTENTTRHDKNDCEGISLEDDESRGMKWDDPERKENKQDCEPCQQPVAELFPCASEMAADFARPDP
jgi:hypothetical protein